MAYLVSFKGIVERAGLHGVENGGAEPISASDLLRALRMLLQVVEVDEAWYRETYPDVADAIDDGLYVSARDHFLEHGYFEGRRPSPLSVDEKWYNSHYRDVAEGITAGSIESGADHFNRFGYEEGRLPVSP